MSWSIPIKSIAKESGFIAYSDFCYWSGDPPSFLNEFEDWMNYQLQKCPLSVGDFVYETGKEIIWKVSHKFSPCGTNLVMHKLEDSRYSEVIPRDINCRLSDFIKLSLSKDRK